MADPFFDKFIADLVKGAAASEGFMRGSRVRVHVADGPSGREEKLANHAGLGAAAGSLLGYGAGMIDPRARGIGQILGAPLGAAIGADEGQKLQAAGSAALGEFGGALAGSATGAPFGNAIGAAIGAGLGGHYGGEDSSVMGRLKHKFSALKQRYDKGAADAANCLGLKHAFLGALGSIAGPMLARAGVGAAARGAMGSGAANLAGKIMPRIGGGMGGMAFDQAASMAGGAVGQKVQGAPH